GCNCRSGKVRIEQSGTHQFLDDEFPGRNVTGMVRRHATANDRVPVAMTPHLGMLFDESAHEVAPRLATTVVWIAARECCFGSSLIATAPRRQKDDRRK